MKLQDIFDLLSYGELGKLSIGNANNNGIASTDYKKIIPAVNLGLTALYRRFSLDYADIYVQQEDHISTYKLTDQYKASNTESTEPYKYIIDSAYNEFEGASLLKIFRVFNEIGDEMPINMEGAHNAIYTPSYNTLQIENPDSNNAMRVVYVKDHPRILVEDLDPTTQDINIPDAYVECLLYYIAGRVFAGQGSTTAVNESNMYMAKFENSCQELEKVGAIQKDYHVNHKMRMNGWV